VFAVAVLVLLLPSCQKPRASAVRLLTTTSAQDSGLLDVLKPEFEERSGYHLEVIAVGTGAALKQGAQGEGDVMLVHDPEAEKKWMAEGNGTSRRLVMYNEFILAGPADDPARVRGTSAGEALRRIAATRALFASRGDKSGTHVRELFLWTKAGVEPKGKDWYVETGQGMGLTLEVASEHQRYVLTDRSTYVVQRRRLSLEVLVEGDPDFLNLYHVMPVNPAKFPRVNAAGGQAFADFLISPEGQAVIREFGKAKYGRALFTPAAHMTEDQLLKP
jgi:tungstate transport system substrate-binding protein